MSSLSRADAEAQVASWGFSHVFTWSDRAHAHYSPHKHAEVTTHLILKGEFIVTYPNDPEPTKQIFSPGARVDVPAGKIHEVWMGGSGCTYVIGE